MARLLANLRNTMIVSAILALILIGGYAVHNGSADLIPKEPAKQQERRKQVRAAHAGRTQGVAQRYRTALADWYGKEKAAKVQHAEAFEVCEYGRRPNKTELARLFPFFGDASE